MNKFFLEKQKTRHKSPDLCLATLLLEKSLYS